MELQELQEPESEQAAPSAPPPPPAVASFKTQANALFRKNLRYQQKNCKTNCCLVLTPLLFSIVLGVVSFLINDLLLSDFSCTGNPALCPVPSPPQFPPLVQVPNPLFRPTASFFETFGPNVNAAGLVDDMTRSEMYQPLSSGGSVSPISVPFVRPSPFLYTNATPAAGALASSLLQDAWARSVLDQYSGLIPGITAELALYSNISTGGYTGGTSGHSNTVAFILYLEPSLPAVGPLMFGTAQKIQKGSLLFDPAWNLFDACSLNSTEKSTLSNFSRLVLGNDNFLTCVPMPGLYVPGGAAGINELIFAGYGQGTPSTLGVLSNISAFPFAIDFGATSTSPDHPLAMGAAVWYNSSDDTATGQPLSKFYRISSVLNRLTNAFVSQAAGGSPVPQAIMRYLSDLASGGASESLDIGTILGPLFYTWLSLMMLPVMVGLLVYEKENNLRTMMKIQGLGTPAYLLVNYIYYFLLYFVFMLLIYLYAFVLGEITDSLSMWTRSSGGVIIVFFILFVNVQISIAFLFQAIFSNAKTATVASVVYILIAGLLGKFLFESFLETPGFHHSGIVGMEILVPFSLYRGYYEMNAFGQVAKFQPVGTSEQSVGISWKKIKGSHGMDDVLIIFFVEWIVIGLAAYYLDQVYSSGSGIRRHPLFFLDCFLKRQLQERNERLAAAAAASAQTGSDGPDVVECREVAYSTDAADTFILARGLSKTYPGQDGGPPKVACRELSVSIPAGECFGLLGPNGAGKSTAINMLIGFLQPTLGAAYVRGYNLQNDLDTVYSMLGVCPQHDLLWEQLSAREHLRFYGRLKNLFGAELEAACDEALRGVNLFSGGVGDRPCGTYSGGMKRRLSVAISLIGDPPVVFLDEPSTGLDPASRATLWEVIKKAKQRRAIVLTTHAMEEAEELCDRLGIFVDGTLRCVGNPKELTGRFGGFLILTLTTSPLRVAESEAFVRRLSPNSVPTYRLGGTLKFDLPLAEVSVASVFAAVTAAKEELGILDWGVANMTLEEVFIKLARSIGATTKE